MDVNDPSYNAGLIEAMNMPEEPVEEKEPLDNVDIEIAAMVRTRKEASRTFRQEKKEIWDQCWNHYKQVYDATGKESWQSTTFIPASPKVAEVITSNMHAALMGPDRPVEYQARRPEFEPEINDANDLISVDFDKCKFKVHWTDVLRSICIIGTGIGKIEYLKETATVTVKERYKELPFMGMARNFLGLEPAPKETITVEKRLVKDYATFKYVDRYDIYEEPGSCEISKDHWIIEEGRITNARLKQLAEDPDPVMRITGLTDDVFMSNPKDLRSNSDKQEEDSANNETNKITAYMDPDQEHVLDEYWGPAPIWMVDPSLHGKEEYKYEMVHAWFWVIDGIYVVRKQVTPWRDAEPPYVKGTYIRVPGRFDGIGPLELMKGLQIELNESRNCRQDEINLKLSKPVAIIKSMVASGEWGRLKVGPGAVWLFDNIDDIRKAMMEIELNANLGDSWRGSLEIMNEIQEVTAAVKATIGAGEDQSGGTFRGQLLNKQTASERFIMYARILEITGLSDAIKKFYQRIYQFKDWESAQQILGEKRGQKFKFISPEDLELKARLIPTGVASVENKGVQLAQMAEEFKLLSGFPWYKQVEAARRMVVARGQADPDSVIFSDEELKMFNEQKKAMIESAGQVPGASPDGLTSPPQDMGGVPSGPIAGDTPPPLNGLPREAMPARGPGASTIDMSGTPLG